MKLTDLFEGKADKIRTVVEYVNDMRAPDDVKDAAKRLCAELIRREASVSYSGGGGIMILVITDEDDASYSFTFPTVRDVHHRYGILHVTCAVVKDDGSGVDAFHQVSWNYSAKEILAMGLDRFLVAIFRDVRKVK